MLQYISSLILALWGWKVEKNIPTDSKILIIGAPHTSNWDFPLTLLALSSLGLRFSWIGKHTLFQGVWGKIFSAIGGIPVNRGARKGFINEMVKAFNAREKLTLAIAPEGTRSNRDHWKTGFYHIAIRAGVNISLGFIDYPTKTIGLGPTLEPTGDIVHDFNFISSFYDQKRGKYPENESTIRLRDKEVFLFEKEYGSLSVDRQKQSHPIP